MSNRSPSARRAIFREIFEKRKDDRLSGGTEQAHASRAPHSIACMQTVETTVPVAAYSRTFTSYISPLEVVLDYQNLFKLLPTFVTLYKIVYPIVPIPYSLFFFSIF